MPLGCGRARRERDRDGDCLGRLGRLGLGGGGHRSALRGVQRRLLLRMCRVEDRLLLRHEARILERLRHWPHAPKVVGQVGKLALLLEYVPGEMLSEAADPTSPIYFAQLMAVLTSLHRSSIVHNDIRGSNIIVSRGRVVLIDFASALYLPGGRLLRFLLRPLRRSDLAGGLKLKARLIGEALTPEEARLRRKPAWIRGLQHTWKRRLLPRLKRHSQSQRRDEAP